MAPGKPCSNCSFDPAQQQIPTAEELREAYLPHYEALRPQFNALHRELQHFADRRAHHGRSLKMSRLICLLVGLIGAAQLVARLLESFTLESAATPSVIILFAFAMDLLVRRSSTHTAERQLRAISLLQTQIELHDQQARPPLAFAFCHPDVLREIIAAPEGPAQAVCRIRQEAMEQAIRDAGRWPLREVEREAMMELGMWNHYTSIPRKTEE